MLVILNVILISLFEMIKHPNVQKETHWVKVYSLTVSFVINMNEDHQARYSQIHSPSSALNKGRLCVFFSHEISSMECLY